MANEIIDIPSIEQAVGGRVIKSAQWNKNFNNVIDTANQNYQVIRDKFNNLNNNINSNIETVNSKFDTEINNLKTKDIQLDSKDKDLDTKIDTQVTNLNTQITSLDNKKADKATTLSGYGITDAYTKKETDDKLDTKVNNSLFLNELDKKANKTDVDTALNTKANKGTTLKDYQIGDAYTKSEINTSLSNKQNKLTFDTIPTSGSTNPVQSGGVKSALDAKADIGSYTQINADFTYSTSNMSDISVIGVSSDVSVADDTIFDAAEHYPYNVPTLNFLKEILITFAGEFSEEIEKKQDKLTFDLTPTSDSTNPVTSDGIYSAINTVKVDGCAFKKDDSGYYIEV